MGKIWAGGSKALHKITHNAQKQTGTNSIAVVYRRVALTGAAPLALRLVRHQMPFSPTLPSSLEFLSDFTHTFSLREVNHSFSRSFSVYPNINESIMVCFFMGLSDIYWPGNSRTFLVRQGPRKRCPIFRRRRHFPYGPQVEHHIAFRATFTATSSQPK